MIYGIIAYAVISLIYTFHSFVSYTKEMEPYGIDRLNEFFSLILFLAGFEGLLFPIFLSTEIVSVLVLVKDYKYTHIPWRA